jgi:hypothetical protein
MDWGEADLDCASFRDAEAIEACTRSTVAHKSLIKFPEYIPTVSASTFGGSVQHCSGDDKQSFRASRLSCKKPKRPELPAQCDRE